MEETEREQSLVEASAQAHYDRAMALLETGSEEGNRQDKPANAWHSLRQATGAEKCAANLERAIGELSRGLTLDPSLTKLYLARAECYLRMHDLQSAVSNLRYAVRSEPGDAELRHKLARLLSVRGHRWLEMGGAVPAAVECFGEAAKLDPLNPHRFTHKAIALVRSRSFEPALDAVNHALTLDPAGAAGAERFVLRAKIHWALGLTDAGNKDLKIAASVAPDHPEVQAYVEAMWKKAAKLCVASALRRARALSRPTPLRPPPPRARSRSRVSPWTYASHSRRRRRRLIRGAALLFPRRAVTRTR